MPGLHAPFIVGAARSGTTLLRLMLDAHPEIAVPPETQFYPAVLAVDERDADWLDRTLEAMTGNFCWPDFRINADAFARDVRAEQPGGRGAVLRAFYRTYAARHGKASWGDKWPGNVLHMTAIAALLPEACFVHIVRDGRDVAVSLRDAWWQPCDSFASCIALWASRIRAAREQASSGLRYLEVRYEALVAEPAAVLRAICAFAGFPYDDAMLRYAERAAARHAELGDWSFHGRRVSREVRMAAFNNTLHAVSPSSVGRWRDAMSPADVAACESAAGDVLAELGYR